jgi:DNA replication protein DnaC
MLKHLLPKFPMPAPTNDNTDCPTCGGTGFIVAKRPIYIGQRYYGDIEEQQDCPDCILSKRAHCEVCGDFGVIRYDVPRTDERFGQLFPCPACPKGKGLAERSLSNLLEGAELPERYRTLSFTTWMSLPADMRNGKELAYAAAGVFALSWKTHFAFTLKDIYARARMPFPRDLVDRPATSLVFEGIPGTGKTGLAAAVCNYLVEKTPVRPLYSRCRDMIRNIQADYGDSDTGAMQRYKRAEFLVIDEMNLVNPTDDRRDIGEEIIRHRMNNSLPTIVTLNNTRAEFEAEWGKRTATVLFELSHWFIVGGVPIRDEGTALQ